MAQDRDSGARANLYGHETSRLLAEKIGALSVSDSSNEFAFEGRLVTIRCAQQGNSQVGVLYDMLGRVNSVIAAFEVTPKSYILYEMTPSLYRMGMRDSKGEERIGLVGRNWFEKVGRPLSTVTI